MDLRFKHTHNYGMGTNCQYFNGMSELIWKQGHVYIPEEVCMHMKTYTQNKMLSVFRVPLDSDFIYTLGADIYTWIPFYTMRDPYSTILHLILYLRYGTNFKVYLHLQPNLSFSNYIDSQGYSNLMYHLHSGGRLIFQKYRLTLTWILKLL